MKKAEDYIKPVILDAVKVDEKQIQEIRVKYLQDKDLDKKLTKLFKKGRNAPTTNGPHPHHQVEGT